MRAALLIIALAGPAAAQDLVFSSGGTEQCIAVTPDPRHCIGASAKACMRMTVGGETTYGMGGCYEQERQYWDARLNQAYQVEMARAKAFDADMSDLGSAGAKQAPALRAMQRAWITFRDEKCGFEYSQWGGGSGGGPAITACLMIETGEQALYLENVALGN